MMLKVGCGRNWAFEEVLSPISVSFSVEHSGHECIIQNLDRALSLASNFAQWPLARFAAKTFPAA